jgi:hypothetical protein
MLTLINHRRRRRLRLRLFNIRQRLSKPILELKGFLVLGVGGLLELEVWEDGAVDAGEWVDEREQLLLAALVVQVKFVLWLLDLHFLINILML